MVLNDPRNKLQNNSYICSPVPLESFGESSADVSALKALETTSDPMPHLCQPSRRRPPPRLVWWRQKAVQNCVQEKKNYLLHNLAESCVQKTSVSKHIKLSLPWFSIFHKHGLPPSSSVFPYSGLYPSTIFTASFYILNALICLLSAETMVQVPLPYSSTLRNQAPNSIRLT